MRAGDADLGFSGGLSPLGAGAAESGAASWPFSLSSEGAFGSAGTALDRMIFARRRWCSSRRVRIRSA